MAKFPFFIISMSERLSFFCGFKRIRHSNHIVFFLCSKLGCFSEDSKQNIVFVSAILVSMQLFLLFELHTQKLQKLMMAEPLFSDMRLVIGFQNHRLFIFFRNSFVMG